MGVDLGGCPEAEPWPGLLRELRKASEALTLGNFPLAKDLLATAAAPFVADAREASDCAIGLAALFRALAFAHCSDPQLEGRALRRANHLGLRFLYLAMTWLTLASSSQRGSEVLAAGGGYPWPVGQQELHDDIMTVSDALRSTGPAGHTITPAGRGVPFDYRRPELRLALVSLCTYPEGSALRNLAPSNHGLYAEKHGYAYLLERQVVDPGRPPAWGKVKLMEHALRSRLWDWVVWVDCDTYFMNMSITLESVIFAYAGRAAMGVETAELELGGEAQLIVSEDGALLNTGIFFARSTDWVLGLLRRVWGRASSPWTQHPWWDNAAFMWELLKDNAQKFALEDSLLSPPTGGPSPDELAGVYPAQVRVVHQASFNSYHPLVAGDLHDVWEEGKFVIAFSGMTSASGPAEAQAAYRMYYHLACQLNGLERQCIREEAA